MLDTEYIEAISTLVCEDSLSEKIKVLRLSGVKQLKQVADKYTNEGIAELPIKEMWRHKLPFVMNATTKSEMEDILRPSTPQYNCGTFTVKSPYHSEAEEMMLWSITSLRGH